jgi:hypothetical protein
MNTVTATKKANPPMTTHTMDSDRAHLDRFPPDQKEKIMRAIMQHPATDETVCEGEYCYENTTARLRARGYQLIDLAPGEGVFTTVWYCKTRTWMGLRVSEHAAMLIWESSDDKEQTTLHTWHLSAIPRPEADVTQ